MSTAATLDVRRARDDARIGFVVVALCVVAHVVFVLLPYHAEHLVPVGLQGLWSVGIPLTTVLGPVAAGLAALASVRALWLDSSVLTPSSRRLHLATLLAGAVLVAWLLSPWGAAYLSWWQD